MKLPLISLKKMFLATVLIVGSFIANAQSVEPEIKPLNIQYIGADNTGTWFEVNYNNPLTQKLTLTIKDENGFVIYEDVFKNSSLLKKIKILRDGDQEMNPTIELKDDGKIVLSESFHIETKSYTVSDVSVTKL